MKMNTKFIDIILMLLPIITALVVFGVPIFGVFYFSVQWPYLVCWEFTAWLISLGILAWLTRGYDVGPFGP